ncbi:hypothetical protein ILYODFUR_016400 [Ilyodon furcidens]|uniref:Uncharacterized protein n=1 Tax=Ilyodon furcidens TaxID=33524 RepID=A0ABV0V3J2_9TELE
MLLEVQREVSTVGDNLGSHVICWCLSIGSPQSTQPSTKKLLIYSSSRIWYQPTLPKRIYGQRKMRGT